MYSAFKNISEISAQDLGFCIFLYKMYSYHHVFIANCNEYMHCYIYITWLKWTTELIAHLKIILNLNSYCVGKEKYKTSIAYRLRDAKRGETSWPRYYWSRNIQSYWMRQRLLGILTHLPLVFLRMKYLIFCLKFQWSLFLRRAHLPIFQYWFRWWHGADQASSHHLNQMLTQCTDAYMRH